MNKHQHQNNIKKTNRTLFTTGVWLLMIHLSYAGSATWNLNPVTGDWNTAANWTPATVPNGPDDTASFDISNTTSINFSAPVEVNSVVFNSSASPFTITNAAPKHGLTISGAGILNDSGTTQNFVNEAGSKIIFENSATTGDLVVITNNGGDITLGGSTLAFRDSSSAGNATLVSNQSEVGGFGAFIVFYDNATASNATIISNGETGNGLPGQVHFRDHSTAENATLISNGGNGTGRLGSIIFLDGESRSSAGNATIIANGGINGGQGGNIYLWYATDGGTARIELFGNANFDLSNRKRTNVTVGSIEGGGFIHLGGTQLSVGSNNLSTTLSGPILDGGIENVSGASLTKIGSGTLVLTGANGYTGGTIVKDGELMVNNAGGSGTGPNKVQVIHGTLSGTGAIDGEVAVGKGNGSGAFLKPGQPGMTSGSLTIRRNLKLNPDATYIVTLNSNSGTTDGVSAKGASIHTALILFDDLGNSFLPPGSVLTILENTGPNPTNGTFTNLPDGSTITIGSNTFQASYEGGDGNDLTLTVQ
jgi:autotransporter-associated beta strand protein